MPATRAFRCPTRAEVLAGVLALLPRGRAWRTHEVGELPAVGAFQENAFQGDAFQASSSSVIGLFWAAFADVLLFVNQRLCALRDEFFCATHAETRDQWMAEYGLPDPCDPFPDLCAKVAAVGGTRCEYFNSVVSRMGWVIDCIDLTTTCGSRVGCSRAGRARTGNRFGNVLKIVVHLDESPSFGGRIQTPPRSGRWRMGRPMPCPANIIPLQCVIDRIAPAHLRIDYVTV